MSQPPQPPGQRQPPIGPDSWWSDIESRPDVAPPRTLGAKSSAISSATSSAQAAASAPAARPAAAPYTAPARPPVSYGVPHQNRKPYPIIILAVLLVLGVGAAGASLLNTPSRGSSHTTPSTGSAPSNAAPKAGPVPEVGAPPAVLVPAPAAPPAAPAPQATSPGPPLAQASPPRAGIAGSTPRLHSGKVRDEDPQRLRSAFTRFFCMHGKLPASYCRSHA